MRLTLPVIIFIGALATSCAERPHHVTTVDSPAPMYPDYTDITIPCNIAPLNFLLRGDIDASEVKIAGKSDSIIINAGAEVVIEPSEWTDLLRAERGNDLNVTISAKTDGKWVRFPSTVWSVAPDSIDRYLSYRLIEPGYEVWNNITLCQRDLQTYDERVLCDNADNDHSCVNCHISGKTRPMSIFHLRGKGGGTIVARDGKVAKYSLKHDSLASAAVYGDIHCGGRWGVFSTNVIIPAFHTYGNNRLEVYDTESDLVVADFTSGEMILTPALARADRLETFPAFSADGKSVFFCLADTVALPDDIKSLKYSLCRVDFDASTGRMGEKIDTLWNGAERGSVCHPKASPDGKYLLFTVADYGTFPLWHREADLRMMRLADGAVDSLPAVNSDRSDTYHSWSSDSRWFVFASKRGDGQYGKPYIAYVDAEGTAHKPFVVPRESPSYYDNTLKSFNIPDLSPYPSAFDRFRLQNNAGR